MDGANDSAVKGSCQCGGGCGSSGNGKFLNETPILDQLESGPWPSFVSGFKELAERTKKPMLRGVLDQLEYSYKTKMGYWKGGRAPNGSCWT